jgi:diadenosine tetraphosphate (Ap4A) HIT family hydrolase
VSSGEEWKCDGSDLCAELSGHEPNEFTRTYDGDPPSRVLNETPHFATVVDISPLVEGHLLVVPRKHYLNFGNAMVDYPDEAIGTLQRARDWVRETYGPVALFEHGSTPDRAGGACIDHAHVHVLPLAAEALVDVMRGDELELEALGDVASWMYIADTSRSYFLCSDGESLLVAFPVRSVRRQYLRSAAGQVLGMSDPYWDWALFINKNLLRETIRRYRFSSKEQREAHSHERGELGT